MRAHLFRECVLAAPTMALTLERFDALGGFAEHEACEDLDLLYRHVLADGLLHKIPESLVECANDMHDAWGEGCVCVFVCVCVCVCACSCAAKFFPSLFHLSHFPSSTPSPPPHFPTVSDRYDPNSTSLGGGVTWLELLSVRVRYIEQLVLARLPRDATFVIWGAGRDGRRFYRALAPRYQRRVAAFADVDPAKLGVFRPPPPYRCAVAARLARDRGERPPAAKHASTWQPHAVPVVPIDDARVQPPAVTCVALDRDSGFEQNLARKRWRAGVDFWYFN